MQTSQTSLFAREDTFFGICEGLGEDLRINPLFLRLALTLLLFFNPLAAIGSYAAAGMLVLLSRRLFPDPRQTAGSATAAQREPIETQAEPESMAIAA